MYVIGTTVELVGLVGFMTICIVEPSDLFCSLVKSNSEKKASAYLSTIRTSPDKQVKFARFLRRIKFYMVFVSIFEIRLDS